MNKNLEIVLTQILLSFALASASVNQLVEKMVGAGAKDASEVVAKSSAEAELLLKQCKESECLLRKGVEEQSRALTSKALQKTQELLADAHEEALDFARNAYEQVEQLKQSTANAVDIIIQQAEEEALRIKAQKRKKMMHAFLEESALREKNAWKRGLEEEFLANLAIIEAVVKEGEAAEEVPQFVETFKKQRAWFKQTLAGIKRPSDPRYFPLYQKLQAIKNIVQGYQRVSLLLVSKIQQHRIAAPDMKKPRLLALYEVQALVMQKKEGDDLIASIFLTERECELIAENLCNKLFAREQKEAAAAVQKDMAEKKAQLAAVQILAEKQQAALKQTVVAVQQEADKQLSSVADKVAKQVEEAAFQKLTPILEGLNKQKASLELIVREQKETISRIQQELNTQVKNPQEKDGIMAEPEAGQVSENNAVELELINRSSLEKELLVRLNRSKGIS
jgi:hypothetical protein